MLPTNTTCTAAKLFDVSIESDTNLWTTHAAVAANISARLAEVTSPMKNENVAVNAPIIPSRLLILSTVYRMMIETTGIRQASTVVNNLVMRINELSLYNTVFLRCSSLSGSYTENVSTTFSPSPDSNSNSNRNEFTLQNLPQSL